jgi:hypothetical protein
LISPSWNFLELSLDGIVAYPEVRGNRQWSTFEIRLWADRASHRGPQANEKEDSRAGIDHL